jgi:predicted HTH domain antitoxin
MSRAEAQHEFRLILAAKLFELRRLTLGQAAEMAGLPVWTFILDPAVESLVFHGKC